MPRCPQLPEGTKLTPSVDIRLVETTNPGCGLVFLGDHHTVGMVGHRVDQLG